MKKDVLETNAFRLDQGASHPLYLFSLRASELSQITTVFRAGRDDQGDLEGYQRTESDRYISDIAEYLGTERAVLPNSIVLSLSSEAQFHSHDHSGLRERGIGQLEIPVSEDPDNRIVDGQQRMLALAQNAQENFPVPVTAIISDDVPLERELFFRVNRGRSVSSSLVNELLPVINPPLPEKLQDRKIPSILCERLNRDPSSPLYGMIRRASTPKSKRAEAVIKDSSLMGAIQESLSSPSGCLFAYHNIATGEVDIDGAAEVLTVFWGSVREVFDKAWGLPAKRSRLMHSAGIQVMGQMMDLIMPSVSPTAPDAKEQVVCELERFAPACRWTSGSWERLGGLAWNDLKGTKQHVTALSKHLADIYYENLPS